jgi:hypothetical protein
MKTKNILFIVVLFFEKLDMLLTDIWRIEKTKNIIINFFPIRLSLEKNVYVTSCAILLVQTTSHFYNSRKNIKKMTKQQTLVNHIDEAVVHDQIS